MNAFELVSNAVRAKEIIGVFARHGFAEVLEQLHPPKGVLERFRRGPRQHTPWERLRMAAEELGPTFVKAGQLLSMRPDVLPEPLIYELRKLQGEVKALPFDQIRAVLQEELGVDPDSLFADMENTPVASASLAQVYRARLREGGQLVAVKVQRPGLRKHVDADLELMAFFAGQLHQRVPSLAPYDLPGVVAELRGAFEREMDFRNEARNLRYFNTTNPSTRSVFAPRIHEHLTRPRVLVMDFVEGVSLDKAGLDAGNAATLAREGARSLFHQILVAGFFHADPHGGNLLVCPDGRLCVLDWGQVGQLTRRMRHFLADLFEAADAQDAERIVSSASLLAAPGRRPDFRAMEKEVLFALREHLNENVGERHVGRVILALLHILGRNGIHVTQDYCLMAKAVLSIEESARALDPNFSLRDAAAPALRQLHRERYSPGVVAAQFRRLLAGAASRLGDMPVDLHRLAQRISQDDLTINFQHRGLEDLDDAINKASSRLTLALIVAALIIGSSLVIHAGVKPLVLGGVSALGLCGYLLSMLIGLWIVLDIFRHGGHR